MWTAACSCGPPLSPVQDRHSAEAPRMVGVGALALWGEAEGPGLVQPGAGTDLGEPYTLAGRLSGRTTSPAWAGGERQLAKVEIRS